jgi:hypothetical protein
MFDKNDPLIGAVQKVMQANAAEREAVKAVNEKLGIQDRKVLPHEKQSEWDAAYQSVLTEGVEALDEAALPKPPGTVKAVKALGSEERKRRASLHDAESARHENVYAKYDSQGKQGTRAAQKALENSTHHSEMAERYRDPNSHFENLKNRERDFADGGIHVYKEEALEEMSLKQRMLARVGAKVNRKDNPKTIGKDDLEGARQGHASHIREDETPMTKMGIKKPDYAPEGETPDYAKSKEQTPNRTAKTSLPAGTVKSAIKENSITSIQEEISYNLAEEAFGIYENNGTQDFVNYIDSLNEEQLELLGMNEEFMQFVINEGLWDSISAGARGAWDSATLGGGKYVSGAVRHGYNKITGKKSSYSDEVDKEDAANKKAEKDNPTAYNVGSYGADAAMLATGAGGIARFAAKQALKGGVKSAAKLAASKPSGVAKAVDSVSRKSFGAGIAGHAGAGLAGQHKGLNEDVTLFKDQLSDYLYENYTIEELDALTEEQVDQIVNEDFKSKTLEYGGKLLSKIPGGKTIVDKASQWMSRGTKTADTAAGTTAKTADTVTDAAKKSKADAIAGGAANRKAVPGAEAKPPVAATAQTRAGKGPKQKKPPETKPAAEAPKPVEPPKVPASKGQKVLDAVKKNKGKLAVAAGAAGVTAAALSGDSTPDDATAQQQSGNGSSGPNRASGSNPANPGSGSSSKSSDKPSGTVKKKKMTLKPKADRNAPGSREARRRVLAGKDGVGPEGKKMRDKAATTLGVTTGKTIRK